MAHPTALLEMFTQKAELVSAKVSLTHGPKAALDAAVDACKNQDGPRIMAAPNLGPDLAQILEDLCGKNDIILKNQNLRDVPDTISMGVTLADWAIADTGTLVLDSGNEDLRLATMLCEIHTALLPASRLVATVFDMEEALSASMENPPDYTAFITGASRTADIERVLALGVHGPLELHILIWEDA